MTNFPAFVGDETMATVSDTIMFLQRVDRIVKEDEANLADVNFRLDKFRTMHAKLDEMFAKKVKDAFRNLAKTLHPDKLPGGGTAEDRARFDELKTAHDTLMNDELRKKYILMNDHARFLASMAEAAAPPPEKATMDRRDQIRLKNSHAFAPTATLRVEASYIVIVHPTPGGLPSKCTIPAIDKNVPTKGGDSYQIGLSWKCNEAVQMLVERYELSLETWSLDSSRIENEKFSMSTPWFEKVIGQGFHFFKARAINALGSGPWSVTLAHTIVDDEHAHDRTIEAAVKKIAERMRKIREVLAEAMKNVNQGGKEMDAKIEILSHALTRARRARFGYARGDDSEDDLALLTEAETLLESCIAKRDWRSEMRSWKTRCEACFKVTINNSVGQLGLEDLIAGLGAAQSIHPSVRNHIHQWVMKCFDGLGRRELFVTPVATFQITEQTLESLSSDIPGEDYSRLSSPSRSSNDSSDWDAPAIVPGARLARSVPAWRIPDAHDRVRVTYLVAIERSDFFDTDRFERRVEQMEDQRRRDEATWVKRRLKELRERRAAAEAAATSAAAEAAATAAEALAAASSSSSRMNSPKSAVVPSVIDSVARHEAAANAKAQGKRVAWAPPPPKEEDNAGRLSSAAAEARKRAGDPRQSKTCRYWRAGRCDLKGCKFAHYEIPETDKDYRWIGGPHCRKLPSGACSFGGKCSFRAKHSRVLKDDPTETAIIPAFGSSETWQVDEDSSLEMDTLQDEWDVETVEDTSTPPSTYQSATASPQPNISEIKSRPLETAAAFFPPSTGASAFEPVSAFGPGFASFGRSLTSQPPLPTNRQHALAPPGFPQQPPGLDHLHNPGGFFPSPTSTPSSYSLSTSPAPSGSSMSTYPPNAYNSNRTSATQSAPRSAGPPPTLESVLVEMNLTRLSPIFEENEIDFEAFLLLDEALLKEMSVPLGPRIKILKRISELAADETVYHAAGSSNVGMGAEDAARLAEVYARAELERIEQQRSEIEREGYEGEQYAEAEQQYGVPEEPQWEEHSERPEVLAIITAVHES
ncbi:hypothetical protein BDK51DRAFT_37383 [Blyttiomyces helicus]|uniref:J domain-containing protein n=1 Tax=Blyttiomyces helicus TaxID=388810 RepID=A0A4P9WL73_9FUNG|nr:hypothetical protein BDK51DRAFT_37383 [Blyttiomyces helicus]|eukprot:RKO93779.1 hypothetical protein BDK51DRAFT_37383 [Blyttiomyces helicus]